MATTPEVPPNSRALEVYQPDAQVGELKLWRAPEEVLAEAQQAAQALQKRIAGKKKPVEFNGEQYIENDDWQMVANFFGYTPKVISCDYVQYGEVTGFKAVAELINEHTGAVVGRGEALCLDEEDNWGDRTKYEWRDVLDSNGQKIWENHRPRRERVEVGTVPTPLFQLMSMAQTRACNKAMSNKLKWVVSLAGYQVTPAEDMHEPTLAPKKIEAQPVDDLPNEIRRKPSVSAATSPRPSQPRTGTAVGAGASVTAGAPAPRVQPRTCTQVISEQQGRRFYAIWKGAGKTKEEVQQYLREVIGVQSDREIPVARYVEACSWAQQTSGGRW